MSAFAIVLIVLGCIGYCVVWVVFGAIVNLSNDGDPCGMGFGIGMIWPVTLPFAIIAFAIHQLTKALAKPDPPPDGYPPSPSGPV